MTEGQCIALASLAILACAVIAVERLRRFHERRRVTAWR